MFPLNWNLPFRKKDGSLAKLNDVLGGDYTLPTASSSTKGGIKVGAGLVMDGETMSSKAVPNLLSRELACGSDDTYLYYIPIQRRRIDGSYDGYEIKTVSTSMSSAVIEIDSILYNSSTSETTVIETLATLSHNGVNTYSDGVISVSYTSGGKWRVEFTTGQLYDTGGSPLSSPIEWAYNYQSDVFLLKH